MKLTAIDSTKTITKGLPYFSVKECDGKVKIMCDDGVNKWVNKSHFVEGGTK